MMLEIQSIQLKANFSTMLSKAASGQEIAIIHHGKIVARLPPWNDDQYDNKQRISAVQKMRAFKKCKLAPSEAITEMRDKGR